MSLQVSIFRKSLLTLLLAPFVVQAALLEEVVVTAQKREQNVQDVGIAITAFTGDQMRTLGYSNAQQITALAPGVSTVQPNGEANYGLAIRGAANSDFVANQESPVSLYVDEVYISQMSGAGFMLFDMERVEILRGPQGTLFGRNATGGLAHFVTRKPEQEFNGYGQVTVGENDQVKFEGAVGGALSDTVAARASISTHHNSGYVTNRLDPGNDLNNANDYAGRVQLLFTPNEDVEFLLNARYSLQQIRTGFFNNVDGSFDPATGLGFKTPGTGNFNGYSDLDGDVFTGDYDRLGFNDLETYGFSGTLKWSLDSMDFTSITDYQSVERDYIEDSDASPFNDFNFFLNTDAEQWSQEFRLNGENEQMKWVTGLYYLKIDSSDANGAEIPVFGLGGLPPITGLDTPSTQEKDSFSIFGQVEYSLSDNFTLIGGFRWIEESVDIRYANNAVEFPRDGSIERNGNPNILATLGTYTGKYDEGLWSAKVELDWTPTDDLLVYASWNRGVKGGGFNSPFDLSALDPTVSPDQNATDAFFRFNEEELDAFELGFKSTLMDGLARLNVALYYNDYKDYQAFDIIGLATNVVSAPDAKNYGFEAELFASPMEGLDLMFGVSYNDNEVTLPTGVKTRAVQTPKWNLSGLARYEWAAFNGSMAIQGDFHYRSEHYHSLTRAPAVTEDGYHVANARLSYTTADEKWEVAVFANNITDEEYIVQSFDLAAALGWIEEYYGRPRWVGGSVNYNF
ncbi:MAG: TonB-dependent receptor plug domain-containing protein [Gammaproteobacteria bacterium]|nr:TonB-dependent receptor plug domain-containing protein [Gammaproteobacteria bacterium]